MTLQQIYYLTEIADVGSINHAAKKLFLSQSALTSAVKEAEEELGFYLSDRNSRSVSLASDGTGFLARARELHQQYELLMDHFGASRQIRQRSSISTQHYSLVAQTFTNVTQRFDTNEYQFSILKTHTSDTTHNVINDKSDVGILYKSSFNHRFPSKIFYEEPLKFHPLIECNAYVYLYKDHPLASPDAISFEELQPYPCIQFDQKEDSSAFLAEEVLNDRDYPHATKTSGRVANLNLMRSIQGYTLCSGIISRDLGNSDYVVVPLREDRHDKNQTTRISHVFEKETAPNNLTLHLLEEIERRFNAEQTVG